MNNLYCQTGFIFVKPWQEKHIDLYIIPTGDPNLGEYVPDHWRIIPWLTGFTGSAATLVISRSFAGLWTDSRYFVQARNSLRIQDSNL